MLANIMKVIIQVLILFVGFGLGTCFIIQMEEDIFMSFKLPKTI